MIQCGKPNCGKCPHGPYYYVVHWVGKGTKECYIGKNWPQKYVKATEAARKYGETKKRIYPELARPSPEEQEQTIKELREKVKLLEEKIEDLEYSGPLAVEKASLDIDLSDQ